MIQEPFGAKIPMVMYTFYIPELKLESDCCLPESQLRRRSNLFSLFLGLMSMSKKKKGTILRWQQISDK